MAGRSFLRMGGALLALAGLTAPALAEQVRNPIGCTIYLTVQGQGCEVRHLYRCLLDPEGDFHVNSYDAEGLMLTAHYDAAFTALERFNLRSGIRSQLSEQPDPLDLATVLDTGSDTYKVRETAEAGPGLWVLGRMALDGDPVTIDGRRLQPLTGPLTLHFDDGRTFQMMQTAFYDADLSMMLSGITYDLANPDDFNDRTPADFIFPGEAGFMSDVPVIGCK